MSYVIQIIMIVLGVFVIGSATVEIADIYRASHPLVTQKTHGEDTEPTFFVKGTLEVVRNNGAPSASFSWAGKTIRFKPLPEEK